MPRADGRTDDCDTARRAADERIAAEPLLPPPSLPASALPTPVEDRLRALARPRAILGVVENGLVRPLDPGVTLPEQARVIIVATECP